jgi:hypothetical protein
MCSPRSEYIISVKGSKERSYNDIYAELGFKRLDQIRVTKTPSNASSTFHIYKRQGKFSPPCLKPPMIGRMDANGYTRKWVQPA